MRRDVSLFFRQLALSYRAGIPLSQGLPMAARSCKKARLRHALEDVLRRVRDGNPLGPALAAHPEAFEEVEVALVSVGEENGQLDAILQRLADRSEKAHHDTQRLVLALLYPGFLFVAALFLPKVSVWFTTSFSAFLLSVLRTAGPFLAVIGLLSLGLVLVRRGAPDVFDRLRIGLPFLGKNLEKLALARFASSLAILYASGVELRKSLRLAIRSMGNRHLERRCRRMTSIVERGGTVGEALGASGVFPRELVDTVVIGEKTGDLDRALGSLARLYEEEAERAIKAILILLPIVIYLFVAIYVGMVVIQFWSGYFKALGSI